MKSSKRGLHQQWYLGCSNEQERKARKGLLVGSSLGFDVLLALLDRERFDLLAVREGDYNDSAWAYKQAHLNGRLEELDRLSTLVRSVTDHNDD